MRIDARRRVIIPREVLESAGLKPQDEVEITTEDGLITIRPKRQPLTRGARAVEALRRNAGVSSMTTDKIMELTRGDRSIVPP